MNIRELQTLLEKLVSRGLPEETPVSVLAANMTTLSSDTGFSDVSRVNLVSVDQNYVIVLEPSGAKLLGPSVTYHEQYEQ